MIRKIVPERAGLTAAQTRDVHYDYNHALGLQTAARFDTFDGEGVTAYYDPFGQPTTSLVVMAGRIRYLFRDRDGAGNLSRLTHGDGAHFSYGYDALGRMTLVHDNSSIGSIDDYVIRYWYKPEGPTHAAVRGAAVPGGFTSVFYYDGLQRLWILSDELHVAGAGRTVRLAYNPAGQIAERSSDNERRIARLG